jgi:hypothetical protein
MKMSVCVQRFQPRLGPPSCGLSAYTEIRCVEHSLLTLQSKDAVKVFTSQLKPMDRPLFYHYTTQI